VRTLDNLAHHCRPKPGASIDDVVRAGQILLEQLHGRFHHETVRDQLPQGTAMTVEWVTVPNYTYGDRPYRLITWRHNGLKIVVTMTKPVPVRVECTPIPGISRARNAEHGLIAIDANRSAASPLLLTVGDVHPHVVPDAAVTTNRWVEQCLATVLTEVGRAVTEALARLGYDS
jgi:hypothetical protein